MQKGIAKLYDEYLDRCQIDRAKMPADQHREMKRAFFGCAGQLLIHMRDDMAMDDEEKAAAAFQEMLDEVQVFWEIEVVTQNAEMAANPKPNPAPASDYIPFTGDWLGVLKQIIPYLEDYKGLVFSKNIATVERIIDDAKLIVAAADDIKKLEGSRPKTFASELTTLVNRYSKENGSNTPDYVLANFLQNSLAAFDLAVNQREGHPEPDLVTRIKNKLRGAGREIMDEIENDTRKTAMGKNEAKAQVLRDLMNSPYGSALADNAPEIKVGLKFMNTNMPGQLMEVMRVDTEGNKLDVKISDVKGAATGWVDNGWNLEHTRWGFNRGEYYLVDENVEMVALFHNNSDAFRRWAEHIKGYKIALLGHQTGVVLPDGVTRDQLETEWQAFEKAHRPHFEKGGVVPGDGGPWPENREVADAIVDQVRDKMRQNLNESPHLLDEKGFFFYLKTGGIGWCRMYGGTPWFMAQTADGQWYTAKQVNQTDIWNAKASEVSADEDAALRKTIPNE